MKWNRSMLPAGKLPLHFLFLTGFVVGLFAVYFGRGILLNRAGMLDEDTLYRMKYMTVDSSILFWYVLCKRCRNFLVLIIMATTYLGWIFCGGVTVKYGFSVGFFLLLRWCEDMHRSIYFYHHTTGQGKKSLPGRLGKLALIWIALVFGCLLECFVNPALLKGFLQFF